MSAFLRTARRAHQASARVVHTHYPGCGCSGEIAHIAQRAFSSKVDKQTPIGFIGLGHMGGHMAHNLLKAGHSLVVYDLAAASLERVQAQAKALGGSVRVMKNPLEVGQAAGTIITMLPSSPHVREAYTSSSSGILKGLAAAKTNKALLIDSSTIDPATAREVAELAAREVGAEMVDAPVSGGVGGAEAGTLTFMVGGTDAAFERARPILARMGKNIVHCGAAGTGQVAKVCNNVVLGMSMAAVAEGMSLGVKLGMDPVKLAGIINTSSGRCWSSEVYNPTPGVVSTAPASRNYTGGFGTALMHKDMGLATDAAKAIGHYMPLASLTQDLYSQVMKEGNGGKDFSFIYEYIKNHKA